MRNRRLKTEQKEWIENFEATFWGYEVMYLDEFLERKIEWGTFMGRNLDWIQNHVDELIRKMQAYGL